jgi:hypothetical protein
MIFVSSAAAAAVAAQIENSYPEQHGNGKPLSYFPNPAPHVSSTYWKLGLNYLLIFLD